MTYLKLLVATVIGWIAGIGFVIAWFIDDYRRRKK